MEQGFFQYVKRAFTIKWNMLALGAGIALGIISGFPGVVIPIVLAGEITFLAGLATNRRFQSALDAEAMKLKREGQSNIAHEKKNKMLETLSEEDRSRFEGLQRQCIDLKSLATGIKGTLVTSGDSMGDLQSNGMNKLLWIYLRLLYSKTAVEHFFKTINKTQIEEEINNAQNRLNALGATDDDSANDKRRRISLEDQVATSRARLTNYQRANDNYEFIKDELARLSAKIAVLAEMAINRQDPNFITSEVDSVSDSVASSEKAMNELDFLTGWATDEDMAPDLLESQTLEEEL